MEGQLARVLLYIIAVFFAAILAGAFFKLPDRTARLFAFTWFVWVVNSLLLMTLLLHNMLVGDAPSWFGIAMTVNASLLAAAPLVVYCLFPSRRSPDNG